MSINDIVVYGTGSIGSIIATFLKVSDPTNTRKIHLVGRSHVIEEIKRNGLTFIPYNCQDPSEHIHTTDFELHTEISQVPRADLIFLTMKAHSMEQSLEDAKHLLRTNPVLVITMNGLGLEDIALKFVDKNRIIQCVVLFPSKLEKNQVINTGGNATIMAEKTNISEKLIPELFDPELIDFPLINNFKEQQWQKAVVNIGMNAVAAITIKTVGEILETEPLRRIISELINETMLVAKKLGITLPEDTPSKFWEFCSRDPNHRPSTQQDLIRNKPTETKFLNGYIVKKGKELDIQTPANKAIYNLMVLIEDGDER